MSGPGGGAGTPSPGWYPDPNDPTKQRWWDGMAWTDHTAPLGAGQPGQQGYGGGGAAGVPAERIDTWLWQSIVATLLCCLPVGIAAIVFSAQAQSALNVGNVAEARAKAKTAKTLTLVAVGLGLSGVVIWFLFVGLAIVSGV